MKYELHITSKDIFGVDMIESIVEYAAIGAKVKEGTLPRMGWPYSTIMVIESDEAPKASATVRVFDENKKEVFAKVLEVKAAIVESGDASDVSLALNDLGEHWSKEQLNDLEWEVFKKVMKDSFGITGRDRTKMTNQYMSKVVESLEESQS